MARRQIKYAFNTDAFIHNINLLAETRVDRIAHPDTLAYLMRKVTPDKLSRVKARMINRLLRMRCLESDRLLGQYYVIAVDLTRHLRFGNKRHCAKCLTEKTGDGRVFYYHSVVDAKLISPRGMALSIETEFVENEEGYDKQDCELKAFYRLSESLKKRFPQLKICLSLDALYANQRTFEICAGNDWKYVITFKKGSMPSAYAEAMVIMSLQKQNRRVSRKGDAQQKYAWATEVEHKGHKTNILECVEYKKNHTKGKRYLWLTNLEVTETSCKEMANNGGRLRWKIENEGFNMQKNGGYELQHIYSSDPTAMKNFYQLLQIAHIINQLMEKGSLLKEHIKKALGGIRNFSRKLLEELRTRFFTREKLQNILSRPFQIRFDSS